MATKQTNESMVLSCFLLSQLLHFLFLVNVEEKTSHSWGTCPLASPLIVCSDAVSSLLLKMKLVWIPNSPSEIIKHSDTLTSLLLSGTLFKTASGVTEINRDCIYIMQGQTRDDSWLSFVRFSQPAASLLLIPKPMEWSERSIENFFPAR